MKELKSDKLLKGKHYNGTEWAKLIIDITSASATIQLLWKLMKYWSKS